MEIKIIHHRARQRRKHHHHTKAFVKNYGEVWFDTRAITNILSLKNVKNKYRVTYDSESEDVFRDMMFVMARVSNHTSP